MSIRAVPIFHHLRHIGSARRLEDGSVEALDTSKNTIGIYPTETAAARVVCERWWSSGGRLSTAQRQWNDAYDPKKRGAAS